MEIKEDENNLLFNDIENILKENQINNDKIDEFLFNKLKENPTRQNIKNIFSKINFIDGNQIETILKFDVYAPFLTELYCQICIIGYKLILTEKLLENYTYIKNYFYYQNY